MKAVVTGGAGFIGSNLAAELIHLEYDVSDRGHFSVTGSEVVVKSMGLLNYLPIANAPEPMGRSSQSVSTTDPD